MIKQSDLMAVIKRQRSILNKTTSLDRKLLPQIPPIIKDFALIITGVRRCGKSTLLAQLIKKEQEKALFLNFDTAKLFDFDFSDFTILDAILEDNPKITWLYFDEIQVIDNWEIYIREKLDRGYGIVITGSNASLLSRELGTKLTGRHISRELFPFSYDEFCTFKNRAINKKSLLEYLKIGGFPQYIKTGKPIVLNMLINDILYRDIAVRYNIRDDKSLKRLLVYLISNVGNLVSATKLKQTIGVKSTATILDYFSFFEQAYLLFLMPKFSYSHKVQLINPKKIYFIDSGLQSEISASFSKDYGRKLENMMYLELRKITTELYYYNEKGKECDFVVCKKNEVKLLIQVCFELDNENIEREQNGLFDAMDFFKKEKGYIITCNQIDTINNQNKTIEVVPIYQFDVDHLMNLS